MAESIQCPSCEKEYNVASETLGRTVKCKECGKPFVATARVVEPESPVPARKSTRREPVEEANSSAEAATEKPRKPKRRPRPARNYPQEWIELDQRLFKLGGYLVLMSILGLVLPYFGLQLKGFNHAGDKEIPMILSFGLAGIFVILVPLIRFSVGPSIGWLDRGIRWFGYWVVIFPLGLGLCVLITWFVILEQSKPPNNLVQAPAALIASQGPKDMFPAPQLPPPAPRVPEIRKRGNLPAGVPGQGTPASPDGASGATPPPSAPAAGLPAPAPADQGPRDPAAGKDQKSKGAAPATLTFPSYESTVRRFGAARVVRFVFQDAAFNLYGPINARLSKLPDVPRGNHVFVSTPRGQMQAVVAPVADLDACVEKIDFGTVTSVDQEQRIITVTVDKAKLK